MKISILISLAALMVCFVSGCQNHRGKTNELKPTHAYVVFGDVVKQGKYELPPTSRLTVSQAILKANDAARLAKDTKVKVIRRLPNHQNHVILVDVAAIHRGDRQKEDPVVQPLDVIIVEDPWRFLKDGKF